MTYYGVGVTDTQRILHVNEVTGHIIEAGRRQPMTMLGGFAYTSRKMGEKIATDRSMSTTARLLLWYLVSHMERGNWVPMTQREMGEVFGVTASTMNQAVGELVRAGYLHRVGTVYRVDPSVAWNGSAAERNAYLRELSEQE